MLLKVILHKTEVCILAQRITSSCIVEPRSAQAPSSSASSYTRLFYVLLLLFIEKHFKMPAIYPHYLHYHLLYRYRMLGNYLLVAIKLLNPRKITYFLHV